MDVRELQIVFVAPEIQAVLAQVALAITQNRDDAEDILQDVAYQLLKKAEELDDVADPIPYLKTCIRNTARNWVKKESWKRAVDPRAMENLITEKHYDIETTLWEEADWIKSNLANYPPDRQEAFIKYHLEGYSLETLEVEYGVLKNTLSQQFSRMRTKLRQQDPLLHMMLTLFMK